MSATHNHGDPALVSRVETERYAADRAHRGVGPSSRRVFGDPLVEVPIGNTERNARYGTMFGDPVRLRCSSARALVNPRVSNFDVQTVLHRQAMLSQTRACSLDLGFRSHTMSEKGGPLVPGTPANATERVWLWRLLSEHGR